MVVVEAVTRLSERRAHTSSEAFPDDALASIRAAVEAVPASVFDGVTKHTEVGGFDAAIADGLSQYEYEGDAAGGFNPNCKLWSHLEFDYSVDLYDADGLETRTHRGVSRRSHQRHPQYLRIRSRTQPASLYRRRANAANKLATYPEPIKTAVQIIERVFST